MTRLKVRSYPPSLAFSPDLSNTAIDNVITSGMGVYNIPLSSMTYSPFNPWFDHACSSAILVRERAHQSYKAPPSELTHAAFISTRNCCAAKIHKARSSFHKMKIDSLNSSTKKCFWSLSKIILNNCNQLPSAY